MDPKARPVGLQLRVLARIGRTSNASRQQLETMLARHGTPAEVQQALDETYAIPEAEFKRQMNDLAQAINAADRLIVERNGKNVDAHGLDEGDRIAASIAESALGLVDPKRRV